MKQLSNCSVTILIAISKLIQKKRKESELPTKPLGKKSEEFLQISSSFALPLSPLWAMWITAKQALSTPSANQTGLQEKRAQSHSTSAHSKCRQKQAV